jgi:hypothetical protein
MSVGLTAATLTAMRTSPASGARELDRKKPEARHVPAIIKFLGYDPAPAGETLGAR